MRAFAVLAGNVDAAMTDWEQSGRLLLIWRHKQEGRDHNGTPVIFVPVDNPDRLYTVDLCGFEPHLSAMLHDDYSKVYSIAMSRTR